MKWSNLYRMRLVLIGVVAALVLGVGGRVKADYVFGERIHLGPAINSSPGQGNPGVSSDGSTLYFGSRRPGGSGGNDIWQVSIVSPPKAEQEGNHADSIQTIEQGNDGKEG